MPQQHTSGPWAVSTIDGRTIGPYYDERQFGGGEITRQKAVAVVKDRIGETECNARLIAAAPTLLEACEQAYRSARVVHGENSPLCLILQAAIRKAKGVQS